ncbi:Pentatricopeptide repeat-containing protein [Acorus calamus]|uniref:Pentatricopeptide repeat-containing protein n=1 Tax=Acorus calamus TaxID=4465 RepID=A0AAV9FII3_ACOCL|nr:Pentatricopeptide repeat-containing protein [Acorus calamus]
MLSPLLERRISTFKDLQQIHAQLITTGLIHHPPHLTKLLSHTLSNSLSYACTLFKHTHPQHYNTILYNTIIRGLVDHNSPEHAILSYVEMLLQELLPDRFTYPSLLKACAQLLALNVGKALHGQAVRFGLDCDLYIETTLITMYAACGDVNSAREVFDRMGDQKTRNLVVWTSMISGYVKNQSPREALALVSEMERQGQVPDEVTMVSALSACGDLKDLSCGKKLHLHIERSKMKVCVVLGTAIVDMYAKCGDLKSARQVFDAMHERNVVAWSAMISGYARNNRSGEAIKTFDKMVRESDQKPNEVTIMAVLSACAQSGNSTLGSWVDSYIHKARLSRTINLQNTLMDMYAKCGRIDNARQIFNYMPEKDIVSWNTMIAGLALHGLGEQALALFSQMQSQGVRPDDITFIGVLSACSHAGLVEEGRRLYADMTAKHGIEPKLEHYGCMVDILSRAGLLPEAEEFIEAMPMEPNGAAWGALLSGCRVHNNVEIAERAAKHLMRIEPNNDGIYVLLSNIFAGRKQWEEVKKVRILMHERGIRKTPGCSSVIVDGIFHEFIVGDHSHPESEDVYDYVIQRLRLAGYVADTSEVVLNIDEEEKGDSVSQHSEKMAVCFGLMKTKPGDELLIMKNLRMCGDCHSAFKYISKVFARVIVVRDRSRFHRFVDGSCSCRDYW